MNAIFIKIKESNSNMASPEMGRFFYISENLDQMDGTEYVDEPSTPMYTPPPSPPIDVNMRSEKSGWSWGNFFAFLSAVASFGAVFYAKQANEQTKAEIVKADSTRRAQDSISNIKDSINFAYKSKIDSISNINAKSLVNAQITALSEAHRQFEITNNAFLQMGYFNVVKPELNKYLTMIYQIKNLGKYPLKIFRSHVLLLPMYNAPEYDKQFLTFTKQDSVQEYIIDTLPYKVADVKIPLNQNYLEKINSGSIYIHVISVFDYINLADKKKYRYKFSGRLENDGAFFITVNDISPLPN